MKKILIPIAILPVLMNFHSLLIGQSYSYDYPGKLIIVGGGDIPEEAFNLFAREIGGKDQFMVYIPTATEDEEWIQQGEHLKKFTDRGFTHVVTLHERDTVKVDTPANLELIRNAKGIFIGGGDQSNLAKVYNRTRVLQEMHDLLARGGVIMGTSAGATIMGSVLIGGDHRKTPHLPTEFLSGFDFLPNSAIDQHVLARNRQFDLIPVLEAHPGVLGLAVDESTAAVVTRDSITVIGQSYMLLYDQRDWDVQRKEWGKVYQPFKTIAAGESILQSTQQSR